MSGYIGNWSGWYIFFRQLYLLLSSFLRLIGFVDGGLSRQDDDLILHMSWHEQEDETLAGSITGHIIVGWLFATPSSTGSVSCSLWNYFINIIISINRAVMSTKQWNMNIWTFAKMMLTESVKWDLLPNFAEEVVDYWRDYWGDHVVVLWAVD
jgi:hypothetical protein